MLKIEYEMKAIPGEKDTSVILACLGSGMKWLGKKWVNSLKEEGN